MATINSYDKGSLVRLRSWDPDVSGSGFQDADGTLTDPTTVTLTVKDPGGTSTSYTYAAGQLTRVSAGRFYRDVTMDTEGTWLYKFVGTGACIAVGWRQINIRDLPL